MAKSNIKKITYKEYLNSLNKKDLTGILDDFNIAYKANNKKASLEKLILKNVDNITEQMVSYFQNDEYINMKLLLKKGGVIKVRINNLLLNFLENLKEHKVVIKVEGKNEYILPKEFVDSFRAVLKNKAVVTKIKQNTEEYNLILGIVETYGALNFAKYYEIYSSKYPISEEDALKRVEELSDFFKEILVYEDKRKKTKYIANVEVKSLKKCKDLEKGKNEYALYSPLELVQIYNFKYMNKFKSYKKLMKFISRNYYVEKGNYKIISKFILIPYLSCNQLDSQKADDVLSDLIDKYFEFNNSRHKDRFMALIKDVAQDYPRWELKGHSEREIKC